MTTRHFISLGAGVQSSCLSLMAAHGEVGPMPDGAIFADTMDEPQKVYDWLEFLEKKLPFPVYKVCKGSVMADGLVIYKSKKSGKRYIKSIIPAFVLQPDGKMGLLGRKCTADYKVAQIVKKIREIVGNAAIREWRKIHKSACSALSKWEAEYSRIAKANKGLPKDERESLPMRPQWAWQECQENALAVSWIGISTDEAHRMKDSREIWIRNEWPLIEHGMSRSKCLLWMKQKGYPEPPRSACKKCPFHSDDEWLDMKFNRPDDFEESAVYEEQLQTAARGQEALTGLPFLHASCLPLRQVKLVATVPGHRQVELFGNECEGLCGV